jgi:nicotinate-nucleotide pyrophosphorylase (carboxylating)
MNNIQQIFHKDFERFFSEDDLQRNLKYQLGLPTKSVNCCLKLKQEMILAGLPIFAECFRFLGAQFEANESEMFTILEGQKVESDTLKEINFKLPFNIALNGERVALNLLQRMSGIATLTRKFVDLASPYGINIIDTRKTTPGLRNFEKYAVTVGGGFNHRFGQTDAWMIKDNHKNFFGGLKEAIEFFKGQQSQYTPLVVEIHSLDELDQAIELGVKNVMLDNFSPDEVKTACERKISGVSYEVSGGIRLDNIAGYLIKGVDAISVGALTHSAAPVDISLKYQ